MPTSSVVSVPTELQFAEPMPGLDTLVRFTTERLDDAGAVYALTSEGPDRTVRLFAVAANAFFPGYAPTLPEEVTAVVGPTPVVLVLTCPPAVEDGVPTANLLAPLAVDPHTGLAVQAILDGDWPLRAPLA